jgi:hypothetical protein
MAGSQPTQRLTGALFGTGIPFGGMAISMPMPPTSPGLMPHCAGVRRMGAAALDLAYVAAGRLDGFWERVLQPWDIAAGWFCCPRQAQSTAALTRGQARGIGHRPDGLPGCLTPFAGLLRDHPMQAARKDHPRSPRAARAASLWSPAHRAIPAKEPRRFAHDRIEAIGPTPATCRSPHGQMRQSGQIFDRDHLDRLAQAGQHIQFKPLDIDLDVARLAFLRDQACPAS